MEKDGRVDDHPPPPYTSQSDNYQHLGVYNNQQAGIPPKFDEFQGQQTPAPGYYPPNGYQQPPGYGPVGQGYSIPGQTTVMVSSGPMPNSPPDHFAYSIFVTICCCWPIGIFAILKASATREAIARGDMQAAQRLSAETRKISHIALGVGIAILVLSIVVVGVYVGLIVSGQLFD